VQSPLLSVSDLAVRFSRRGGWTYAVNGVSFDLEQGETLGFVGESGCGKTVTSLAIMRLLPKRTTVVDGGPLLLNGRDLLSLDDDALRSLRGKEMAMVFQDPLTSLNPVLTIGEQVMEAIQAHGGTTRTDARRRALELLLTVGIPAPESQLGRYPHHLSGGMRQRVMIAGALALEPRLLIADEPTTALDVTIQAQVLELLRDLTSRTGTSVILISHDLGVVAGMAQRVNVMYAGYIVETGTTQELFAAAAHPYTVGLLHSIPRAGAHGQKMLIPIQGVPPDVSRPAVGCPFAPRCAWRLPVCWTNNPGLTPLDDHGPSVTTGPAASHQTACHNPPTPEEAKAGIPLRPGFTPAPAPAQSAEPPAS
jgi:oligopeptide/dipeptide ABC transporter ATP-binding protein